MRNNGGWDKEARGRAKTRRGREAVGAGGKGKQAASGMLNR